MWSEVSAVQVTAWRILTRLSHEVRAAELLEVLYPEDELMARGKGRIRNR